MCSHLKAQTLQSSDQMSLAKQGYQSSTRFTLPERASLTDYERALVLNNPMIRASYGAWQAEVKKIAVAKGLPDPKINFGYFVESIETAVGPQEYKIGVMQMIPWLGKLFVQGNIQARRADAAYQNLQSMINSQLLIFRHLYYDYYFLERSIDLTSQNLALVNNWEKVILNGYKTAIAEHANLIKTQIEAIKLSDDLASLEAKRVPLMESIRAILNFQSLNVIHFPDSLQYLPVPNSKEEILNLVLENNPGLKATNFMSQAAGKAVSRAKMNFLPDFSIGVDIISTGDKFNTQGQPVPESGKDPLVLMSSVTIPLWFNKQSAAVNAAKHQKRKAEAEFEGKGNTVRTEFEKIWFELEDSERKVTLYRELLIPKSIESLRASEKAYISGTMDFLNLIDAQRRFLQFELTYVRNIVRYHKTRARLEALAGRTL
jgi:cobalt-zinc-cadmium efflux system outer membrane protein